MIKKRYNMSWEQVFIIRIILIFVGLFLLILGISLDNNICLIIISLIILLFTLFGKRILRGVKI